MNFTYLITPQAGRVSDTSNRRIVSIIVSDVVPLRNRGTYQGWFEFCSKNHILVLI